MAFGETSARDPQTRPEKLARLARSGNPTIRRLVASNPSTPATALSELATDHDAAVVIAVAGNRLSPAAVLEDLSRSNNSGVREVAAANPATPVAVLAEIVKARSTSDREKLAVAANPSASAATLSELRMTRYFKSSDIKHRMLVTVASNPSASEDTLRHLFRRDEKSPTQQEINRAIAGNPTAPLDTRAELFGMDAYREVVLASEPRQASKSRIASARAASNRVAELLAQSPDPEVRRAVALAPGASDTILAGLSDDAVPEVALVARARRARDESELQEFAASTDVTVIEALIRNTNMPVEHIAATVRDGLSSVGEDTLEILAKDPGTPSHILSEVLDRAANLTQWRAAGLKKAVASNPQVSAETLRTLAMDDDSGVRTLVAKSPAIPMEILVKLATDADPKIREVVAKNSTTPVELLLRFATDEIPAVVEATAIHPNVTATVLDRVVNDQLERRKSLRPKSPYNRDLPDFPLGPLTAVSANPRTNKDTLRTLADSVGRALKSTPDYFRNETVVGREVRVWAGIAGNASAPDDLLDQVARAVHEMVWTTDPDRGSIALESLRESTLSKIVKNPSASVETLQFLSSGDWVARRTTKRSERDDGHTTTWTVWDHSATAAAKQDMASSVKKELSRRQWSDTSNSKSRLEFASNPDASLEILEDLSRDSDIAVRCAVAANPSTDPKVFQQLAADPAIEVRLAAAAATHPDLASLKHGSYRYSVDPRESRYRTAFDDLAGDKDATVRSAVAENLSVFWSTLSQEARDRYAFDDDRGVRASLLRAIAGKERSTSSRDFGLSVDALVHLIDTSDADVWRNLAEKGFLELPVTVLNRLADTGDTETVVRVVDAYHADLPLLIRLAASEDSAVVAAVAAKHFFRDDDWSVDEALEGTLLKNPLTPGDYLLRFASEHHMERRVERAIGEYRQSESPPTSWSQESFSERLDKEMVVRKRAVEQDERFLRLAFSHPNFPEAALIEYASGANERLIYAAVSSGNMRVLVATASNPASPVEVLGHLVERVEPEVRQALIDNRSTPPELLVRLIESGRV